MADRELTAEQETEAQRLATLIVERAQAEALRLARRLVSKPDAELLGPPSSRSAAGSLRRGDCCEPAKKRGHHASSRACADCVPVARFVENRPKAFVSLLGEVWLRRAYFHCRRCGWSGILCEKQGLTCYRG